jgi:signal transduction histidine kinase
VSLALDGDDALTGAQRARCAAELRAAAQDLREAMQRPLAPLAAPDASLTLRQELERLDREHGDLGLRIVWDDDAEIPPDLEPLAQSVLAEAVRNARKHAAPDSIDVRVRRDGEAVAVEVINDGVDATGRAGPAGGAGMGLRLAAFEALNAGAAVDFGPTPPDRWHVRLVLPITAA